MLLTENEKQLKAQVTFQHCLYAFFTCPALSVHCSSSYCLQYLFRYIHHLQCLPV